MVRPARERDGRHLQTAKSARAVPARWGHRRIGFEIHAKKQKLLNLAVLFTVANQNVLAIGLNTAQALVFL
jgi:hypothetical protein